MQSWDLSLLFDYRLLDTALHLNIVFGDQFSFNLVIEHHERLQHDEEFLAIWHIAAGKEVKT